MTSESRRWFLLGVLFIRPPSLQSRSENPERPRPRLRSLPSVLSGLSGKRRKRLEVRRQVTEIVWLAARTSPCVGKVEADLNSQFFRHVNRASELVVPVVPAK